ncbi:MULTISPECIES: hypothetical protein [unclassified Shewanella]|uniref:hypothetical protein n=1 Tax=unclassified Shewanella TaxID=196818 RepID=UPI001BBC0EF5|nr:MULTISPECIES: hypothetical protein [unclassified Shewanella]GIU14596.1 hypothetical protein TUM4444_24610 [Shewanella sp. MBTL60-112-B1]GIU39436.1 hypothetical protein TUM4445_35840 [Shewanella sp. MBTL60-112-B2]
MQELTQKEIQEVNGGVAALYWVGVGVIRGAAFVYRSFSATQIAYGAGAATGAGITIAAGEQGDK